MTVLATDSFVRGNQSGSFGTGSDGGSWTQRRSNQTLSIASDQGVMTYNGSTSLGVMTYTSQQPSASEITFNGLATGGSDIVGGVLNADSTGNNFYHTNLGNVAGHLEVGKNVAGSFTSLGTAVFSSSTNTEYSFRFQAGVTANTLKSKVWLKSGSEPGAFMITVTDSALSSGFFGLCAAPDAVGAAEKFDTFQATNGSTTTTITRTITPVTAALLQTNTRTITDTTALLQTNTRTISDTAALLQTSTRTIPDTAALLQTNTRTIPDSAALLQTNTRAIPVSAALVQTDTRSVPTSAALLQTDTRSIPASTALLATSTRAIPASAALLQTDTRIIGAITALLETQTRPIPGVTALLQTSSRNIPSEAVLLQTSTRTISASAALVNARSIPCAAALSGSSPPINAMVYVRSGQASVQVRSGAANVAVRSGRASIIVTG